MDLAETPDSSPNDDSDSESDAAPGSWLQILANYATLVVAVSAVTLSVWEGCEMRRHNRLSVLPNLDVNIKQLTLEKGEGAEFGGTIETMPEPAYYLRIAIENTGLGPAVFEEAKLFRAGQDTLIYETKEDGDALSVYRAESFVRRMQALFPGMSRFTGSLQQGIMMKAGEEDPFLETAIPESVVPDTLDEDPRRYLLNTIDRYSFVVAIRENHSDTILFVGIVANPETA